MTSQTFWITLIGLLLTYTSTVQAAKPMQLAAQGKSKYRIVIDDTASPSVQHAAQELQQFIKQISGATIPIVHDTEPAQDFEIVLGPSDRLKALNIDTAPLGNEGYLIRTIGSRLIIAGGDQRGTLYGVYGLLEDHLGCRWFTPEVSRIPKINPLALPTLNEQKIPALEYRDVFTFDCDDGDWSARNRVNSSRARLGKKHGGKITFGKGYFVHTFERMVPPNVYFDQHPEYFSLIKGKRVKKHSQLCTTNEDVIQLCIEAVRKVMREQPNATVFSVSQNDWFNYCECASCQAVARHEQSQIGPVLALVNRVAEAVAEEFPDKLVETLAYQWTRKPPKYIRPHPNVIVRLCTIECCFAHPLNQCDHPANKAFCKDAEGWSQLTKRLWVWDYGTNFRHYLMPFPNQRLRDDNIRYLISQNVKGIMLQDVYNTAHSEMVELGGYLTAKFLWNPDYDEAQATNEFLDAYYGAAAKSIAAYLKLLHDHVVRENKHATIFMPVNAPYLTNKLLIQANVIWEQAEQAVMDDPTRLERVKRSRLSPDYAIIERAKLQQSKPELKIHPDLLTLARQRVDPYLKTLQRSKVRRITEWKVLDYNQYAGQIRKVLDAD